MGVMCTLCCLHSVQMCVGGWYGLLETLISEKNSILVFLVMVRPF